jgi:hypothetical protein
LSHYINKEADAVQPESVNTLPEALTSSSNSDEAAVVNAADGKKTAIKTNPPKKEDTDGDEPGKKEFHGESEGKVQNKMRVAVYGAPQKQQLPVVNAAKAEAGKPLAVYEQSIIQMLDRWVPDEQTGMYFKAEAFPDSVKAWDGIPLVFANEHPDLDLFQKDPQAALEKVQGRIVGQCSDTRFIQEGHPHIRSALEVTDKECVDLWTQGLLSLSTAFYATVSGTDVEGDIQPNHVLLFKETDVDVPKDKGTLIQKGPTMTDKQALKHEGRVISQANADELNGIIGSLSAFLARLKDPGTPAEPADDPKLAGIPMNTGQILPAVTDQPHEDDETKGVTIPGSDQAEKNLPNPTQTPAGPAAKPITPPGANLPEPPKYDVQAPQWGRPDQGAFDPSKNKVPAPVDTMTAETEALTQKVAGFQAEIANKNLVIAEKDKHIESITAQLAQKDADFKVAAEILAAKDAEIANKVAALKASDEKIAAMVQKEDDAAFQAYVQTLPVGFSNKEEDVKVLRELWNSSPKALAQKTVAMLQSVKVPQTNKEGTTVMPQAGTPNTAKRSLGVYNMLTHKWEDTPVQ